MEEKHLVTMHDHDSIMSLASLVVPHLSSCVVKAEVDSIFPRANCVCRVR